MSNNNVFLSLKAQDRLREWFSKRGDINNVVLTDISLGDSDVDYELSLKASTIKTLPAPYEVPSIKYKLAYSGIINGVTGTINTYLRHVIVDPINSNRAIVSTLYDYPPDETFTHGDEPPRLINGKNWNTLTFTSIKEGYIIFPETLPDNYTDDLGDPLRYKETYYFTVNNLPATWEAIQDNINGSLMIVKPAEVLLGNTGTIDIIGKLTGIKKIVYYNY